MSFVPKNRCKITHFPSISTQRIVNNVQIVINLVTFSMFGMRTG